MSHVNPILQAIGRLLAYPDDQTVESAEFLYVALQEELPDTAKQAAEFGAFIEQYELWEVEEAFTRTFDINPPCALEVGWHLFGEEYERGQFLVRMREEMRKYGLEESTELPDHISHVLSVISAMSAEEAAKFVSACVQPAIEKMQQALEGHDTPYLPVINCLAAVLKHAWGDGFQSLGDRQEEGQKPMFKGDPLRDYPVADYGAGCGGEVELVSLQEDLPYPKEQELKILPNDPVEDKDFNLFHPNE